MLRHLTQVSATIALLAWHSFAMADVDFARDLKPLFHEKCNACHGALKQKAGLRTDAVQLLRAGGESGRAIVPGKPDESLLIHAVEGTHDVLKMPKEGSPLSAEQIRLLRAWIEAGAKGDDEPVPPSPTEHWAFKVPIRPAIPPAKAETPIRNPIDALVRTEQERLGLTALPPTPRRTLLRRVYLDLVGVPPTPAQMQAFLADESADAYEKVVDRLLADARYGQRWGRHWMDVWRYADWAGYKDEIRESRRGIWRWRDWIIESLNADRPYDEMVRLMLASDELAGDKPGDLRAGGYLARSWYKFNKNVWMDNTVEHFGKAFLGLTLNCARCHDHKYDPIEQVEYYQLRAYFEPIAVRSDPVAGLPDQERDGIAMVYDKDPGAATYLLRRGDEKQPVKDRPIAAKTPSAFGDSQTISPVKLPPAAWYPGLRDEVQTEILAKAISATNTARRDLEKLTGSNKPGDEGTLAIARAKLSAAEAELASIQARIAADRAIYQTDSDDPAKGKSMAKAAELAERKSIVAKAEAAVLVAKNALAIAATQPAARMKKPTDDKAKALAVAEKALVDAKAALDKPPTAKYTPLTPTYSPTSTGRRSALAAWVASPKNPLTARVAVNHLWMRHFGEPLVRTEFDFGLNGKPPTHPALLDWLAVEFMEQGWSMKSIHRLIVTSDNYCRSSGEAGNEALYAANQKIDPDNRWLWRANVRRMDAEVVRDSLLAVAGKLDISQGGEELDENAWQSSARRSLYYRHAAEKQGVFALVFDAPSPAECYRRVETVTPQQSLALANSPLAVSHARLLAGELSQSPKPGVNDEAFIRVAFERILNRPPMSDELSASASFLESQSKLLADAKRLSLSQGAEAAKVPPSIDPKQRARENLVLVLFNHNDFVSIR